MCYMIGRRNGAAIELQTGGYPSESAAETAAKKEAGVTDAAVVVVKVVGEFRRSVVVNKVGVAVDGGGLVSL